MAGRRYREQTRNMKTRFLLLCGLGPILAGCTSLDGIYYPGCPAYAGDKVELADGKVTWDRFTDEVRIGADGKPVDLFPGYPRQGSYSVDGKELSIELSGEDQPRRLHILVDGKRLMLLSEEQHAEWRRTGRYDECALTREIAGEH